MDRKANRRLLVRSISAKATRGWLEIAGRRYPCALGRIGRRVLKREGDGATPIGVFQLHGLLYRRDRHLPPRTAMAIRAIKPADGWCDDPLDRNYNRRVSHPYPASAEHLARDDHLYDFVVMLGHNDRPRRRGCGSAVFMHLARPDFAPTAGCVALSARDFRLVLAHVGRGARLVVPA